MLSSVMQVAGPVLQEGTRKQRFDHISRKNAAVDDALAYVLAAAPGDVARTIQWLADKGFEITDEMGGPTAPFGDAQLTFHRRGLGVRVTRDRSQWSLDVALTGLPFLPLDRILTAKDGTIPVVKPRIGPMPEQLPSGVSWTSTVPEVVEWVESGDRRLLVETASGAWAAAIRKHFESFESQRTDSESP